jgi:asparagine synthase (glutamine-hydrolysing)
MPGIVGLITKMPRECAEPRLLRMLESMRHLPSYGTGSFVDESSGIYLAWTTRKNCASSQMPFRGAGANTVLVFSGEEFSGPEAARGPQGQPQESEGSSYIAYRYEAEPTFPASLNGRFHGVVVDRPAGTATLFNDRYGLHRIYYHESRDAFYFAAEAKALLAVLPELRTPDAKGLGELVSCGCVLENRSVFKGIQVLPPASSWVFRDRGIERKGVYFQASDWENQEPFDAESYYGGFRDAFAEMLPRYFKGNEGIGMSLTGGLDTRMIMAWQKRSPGDLPCYSFGGPLRDCEDVRLARQVAAVCRQPYTVIPVSQEFLSRFAHYSERTVYLTDGCASVRCSADLYANELAAQVAPVRMTGNYGSEVLRRLVAFKATEPTAGLFHPEFLPQVRAAQSTYAELREGHALSFIAFRQVPWHHYGLLALEESQVALRSPFLDNKLVRTAFRAPDSSGFKTNVFENNDYITRLIAEGSAELGKIRTDRGLGGARGPAFSALSRAWHEFTFKAEYAYDYGMPQRLASVDHRFSGLHLERLFLGRHKFLHFRVWYRDQLAKYVQEMLLDPRTLSRPYLNRPGVEAAVRGHVKGNRNYTKEIHTILTLEHLHRLFLDA